MDDRLFLARHGARHNVSRVVVVITDGASRKAKATLEAARALRDHGATIFAIGVGRQVRVDQLSDMASRPSEEFVFEVTNFQALASIKSELVIKTCQGRADFGNIVFKKKCFLYFLCRSVFYGLCLAIE